MNITNNKFKHSNFNIYIYIYNIIYFRPIEHVFFIIFFLDLFINVYIYIILCSIYNRREQIRKNKIKNIYLFI